MIRLTYASRLSPNCGDRCIDEIVEASAPSNRSLGITGVLAVDGGRVLQILEGPEDLVLPLFEHIRRDDRHIGVVELGRVNIEKPHFDGWGMVRRPMADAVMFAEML